MDSESTRNAGWLNEHQARRLRVTCQYVDKLLCEIEYVLNAAASKAAFPQYCQDVSPAQRRIIEDFIIRVRAQLVHVLEEHGIPKEQRSISASHSIHAALISIDDAFEELKPQYMRGFGGLPESAATELDGIVRELQGMVENLDRHLLEKATQDPIP